MLQFTSNQMTALSDTVFDAFIDRLALELRTTYPRKLSMENERSAKVFANDVTKYGQQYGIAIERNLKRFVESVLQHDLEIPLHPSLQVPLRSSLEETARVDAFVREAEFGTHKLIVISLESDLDQLNRL